MNIPDEAVEVAARVYRDQQSELGYPKWEDLPEWGREMRIELMRKALEAVSPRILAEAWQDGATDGHLYGIKARNPYRSAGAGE